MAIAEEVQKLDGDSIVSLYTLDTTPIGGSEVFRFTTMPRENELPVTFDGITYQAADIEANGFKWDGQGAFPRPKLLISNVSGIITAAIIAFGDLVGSKFTRIRTYEKHLDDGSDPDPTATFPLEIFILDHRTEHNNVFVEYQLTSTIDQPSVMLPGRTCIRETCTHTYRIWDEDSGTFDYSNATCPYVGSSYFRESGSGTSDPANDVCSKTITSGCKKRFGETGVLPTRAFPGISRNRV